MDMIRRELPRTERAGWGRSPFRIERKEGSPFRGACAVIGFAVQENIWLLFYAAIASLCFCSVFNAIAHMKPSSSRPSAVTIWFLFLPRAANVLYRCVIDAAPSMRFVSLHRLTTAISVFSAGTL